MDEADEAERTTATLNPYHHCTLQTVADDLGVSVERARQIESSALRKLRNWCWRNGYKAEQFIGTDPDRHDVVVDP